MKDLGKRGNAAARAANPDHQADAGRAGFAATVARHFQGDAAGYMAYLRSLASAHQLEALTDQEHIQQLANGRSVVCSELPPLEDYEPLSWRESVSRQGRGRGRAG